MSEYDQPTVTFPVKPNCDDHDCLAPAEYACVVTGDYGKDGVAVYCGDCAEERDGSDHHIWVGEVDHGE